MTKRSVVHAMFVLERVYPAAPKRVFRAWSDPASKAKWFGGGGEWTRQAYELDFRVGGREVNRGARHGDAVHAYEACYQDIVPDERIVYSYDMHIGDVRISVSLATVEFKADGGGTRLVLTEQGAFLDGYDDAGSRERGTRQLLENLAAALGEAA